MRTIKFRIWADGKMDCSPETFTGWLNDNFIFDGYDKGKEPIVMQFTGLLDKSGKEIYEGDIVKYDESEKISAWVAGETAIVMWVAPRFTFRTKPYEEFTGSNQNMPSEDDAEFLEVVGNIYENPELLTQTPN